MIFMRLSTAITGNVDLISVMTWTLSTHFLKSIDHEECLFKLTDRLLSMANGLHVFDLLLC